MAHGRPSVLFIAPSAYPLGGLATWLDYLLPGLEKRGWDVTLGLASGRFHRADAYLHLHPFPNAVRLENPTGTREGRVRTLCRAIARLKPDAVLGVNIPDAYAAVERLRARGGGGPRCVMTIHGIQPDLYDDAREFGSVLDAVVCTNRLACELAVRDAGIERARVFYAPYGVELPPETKRETHAGEPLRICYVGRLDHFQKRALDLPPVLPALENAGVPYVLKIAGGGPAEKELNEQLVEKAQSGAVQFLGVLPQAEVERRLYPESDVLLVTSFWETGPIVIWEAMARGVAVATSGYVGSGLEGALRHGENCMMFPVGDAAAAASCLKTLADADKRLPLVAAGRELVRNRYTIEKSVSAWDGAIRAALALPGLDGGPRRRPARPSGRLDRLLGISLAEHARELLGRRFAHSDPGGEWPHSNGGRAERDEAFWRHASDLDMAA